MSLRIKKVEKELQEIIANYLLTSFPYRNDVIVSISNVVVSKDLKLAKVYYSFYSPVQNDIDTEEVAQVLIEERINIQSTISEKLKMKFTPKLKFFYDDSFEEHFEMREKLKNLGFEENKSL